MRKLAACLCTAAVGMAWLTAVTQAATITYVGEDTATGVAWRDASVAKPAAFDPNKDNIYGSDGWVWAKSAYTGVSPYSGSDVTMVYALPAYIQAAAPAAGTGLFWSTGYTQFGSNDPTSPPAYNGDAGSISSGGGGNMLTFTLGSSTSFLLTVISNTQDYWGGDAYALGVQQTAGGSANSGLQTINPVVNGNSLTYAPATPIYSFFTISGSPGDQFTVYGQGNNWASITGVGFEAVPEPTSLALGLVGIGLILLRRSRKQGC